MKMCTYSVHSVLHWVIERFEWVDKECNSVGDVLIRQICRVLNHFKIIIVKLKHNYYVNCASAIEQSLYEIPHKCLHYRFIFHWQILFILILYIFSYIVVDKTVAFYFFLDINDNQLKQSHNETWLPVTFSSFFIVFYI